MAITTEQASAKELREQRDERVAREQDELAAARERAAQEAADAAASVPHSNGNGNGNGSHVDAQEGLFDEVIENGDLERALEEREEIRVKRSAINVDYKDADEKAKGIIETLDVELGTTIRCGRFRFTKSRIEAKSVAFETEASTRLNISLVED